jgi:hypothetical protein
VTFAPAVAVDVKSRSASDAQTRVLKGVMEWLPVHGRFEIGGSIECFTSRAPLKDPLIQMVFLKFIGLLVNQFYYQFDCNLSEPGKQRKSLGSLLPTRRALPCGGAASRPRALKKGSRSARRSPFDLNELPASWTYVRRIRTGTARQVA